MSWNDGVLFYLAELWKQKCENTPFKMSVLFP